MTLEEIIDTHSATFSIKLKPKGEWCSYFAHISFGEGNIQVEIYDEEGSRREDGEEPMPYAWIEQITKLVQDLKDAKIIPNYTLSLIPEV